VLAQLLHDRFEAAIHIQPHLFEAPVRILPERPHLLQELDEPLPGGKHLEHHAPQLMAHLRVFPQ
jgi:hypothetical protein